MEKSISAQSNILTASIADMRYTTMKLHNARLARVVEHLESHLYEDLDIEKLLALCHYSRYHFHHLFRAYYGEGVYATAAGQAWGQLMPFLYGNRLMQAEVKTMGISHDDPNVTQPENIRYDACAALETQLPLPDGLGKKQIAGGSYAMLLHVGAYEGLSETYGYALTEWLPSSGYELRDAPYFEVYRNRDPRRTKPENLRTEVYIPVQK